MTPRDFAIGYIRTFEDGGSTDPNRTHSMVADDNGNWTGSRKGVGALVGSNHGVTPAALAGYRKVPVEAITRAIMHALTVEEAADIALADYYFGPNISDLPWDQCIASVMDMGWGAGPAQAIKLLQDMVGITGADRDGKIGSPAGQTVKAYVAYVLKVGVEKAALEYAEIRNAFYDKIIARNPTQAKFRNGWRRRTAAFLPGTAWWNGWGKAKAA